VRCEIGRSATVLVNAEAILGIPLTATLPEPIWLSPHHQTITPPHYLPLTHHTLDGFYASGVSR
jgi:hypothetical protein